MLKDSLENRKIFLPNVDIENIRVNAANEIRKINLQIKKINNLGNDYKELQYIGSTIPQLVSDGLPNELAQIEKQLFVQRTKYKNSDKTIISILKRRDVLINLLKIDLLDT